MYFLPFSLNLLISFFFLSSRDYLLLSKEAPYWTKYTGGQNGNSPTGLLFSRLSLTLLVDQVY